jgi:secretion/DNA translocation related TadE-like protein
MTRRRGLAAERGSGAVWVLVSCLVTWAVATVCLAVGAAVVARHRAAMAADLSALAGAASALRGEVAPCVEAARVASSNQAHLVACDVEPDGSLQVVAEAVLPRLLARWPGMPPARERSRAGGMRSITPGSARRPEGRAAERLSRSSGGAEGRCPPPGAGC